MSYSDSSTTKVVPTAQVHIPVGNRQELQNKVHVAPGVHILPEVISCEANAGECLWKVGKTSLGPQRASLIILWVTGLAFGTTFCTNVGMTVTFCPLSKLSLWLSPLSHLPDWKRRQYHTCWDKGLLATERRLNLGLHRAHSKTERETPEKSPHPWTPNSIFLGIAACMVQLQDLAAPNPGYPQCRHFSNMSLLESSTGAMLGTEMFSNSVTIVTVIFINVVIIITIAVTIFIIIISSNSIIAIITKYYYYYDQYHHFHYHEYCYFFCKLFHAKFKCISWHIVVQLWSSFPNESIRNIHVCNYDSKHAARLPSWVFTDSSYTLHHIMVPPLSCLSYCAITQSIIGLANRSQDTKF